jgi:hypothetical protein|tara:strand:- start:46871 stop:48253 length:1383 start_codon:yes stop_codon:yes gene_type:complete
MSLVSKMRREAKVRLISTMAATASVWALCLAISFLSMSATAMVELEDSSLREIVGQDGSLFLADHVTPNSLTGAPGDGSANFDFYRMGLDVKMDLNLNMSKFQLGCGGVNDLLTGPGCDIDIDYLSFMGINNSGTLPSPDGPESAFELTRPYIELAIKNDNSVTQREVVGIKIGGQKINGALSIGRDYTGSGSGGLGNESSLINQEHGGACSPGATTGQGVVNCHSGINSISGFLSLELSAAIRAKARLSGIFDVNLDTCFGRMNPSQFGCTPSTTPFFVDAGGTRLTTLHVAAAKLNINAIDLGCAWWNVACHTAQAIGGAIVNEGYGQLKIDMRQVHYLLTPDTENFFISMQRERVAWPNYSKAPPPSNIAFDSCNPAYGQQSPRCSSAYAPTANTGWWLNAPGAKLLNINPPDRIDVGNVDLGTAISLLGPEGRLIIDNPKISLPRVSNCYGGAVFC